MTDRPSALSGAFGRPFAEQIAFFRRKLGNLVPTRAWDDLLAAEHDNAFMVAGAMKADLLADLAAAVDRALVEGRGIDDFRRDFDDIVRRHGWTGWTGEGTTGGEAWRVKTILSTNANTSYAAGRYAQLKASNFRYWIYHHGGSREPRPQHLDWDGLILPPDHRFWSIFYPPSDWGCSCYVTGAHSMTAAKLSGGDPDKRLEDGWDAIDPSTGTPAGTGRGWNYAPGASVADAVAAMAEKIRHWDYQIGKAFMSDLPSASADALADAYRGLPSTGSLLSSYARRALDADSQLPPIQTLGRLRADQAQQVRRATGVDVSGFDFSLDRFAVLHVFDRHGNAGIEGGLGQQVVTPESFGLLGRVLNDAPRLTGIGPARRTGNPVIETVLRIGGQQYVVKWEIRRKRRTLALSSMFIRLLGAGD